MTRERLTELWPVMEAFKAGKRIQWRTYGNWQDFTGNSPDFEDWEIKWRVKPEPREVWINEYPDGFTGGCYPDRLLADQCAQENRIRPVRFVEVTE